jgi:choline dehydrogenase
MSPDRIGVFDYVIVGAGSAGCVLASRLSAGGRHGVALIEAGGADASWKVRMPAALAYPLANERYLWRFETAPEPGLGSRRLTHPRGRLLGGTSSINGMMYVRGHPFDFDRWAEEGCAGWSFADVQPYFRRLEASAGGDPLRGTGGPLAVKRGDPSAPLNAAFLAAAAEAGYPRTPDINAVQQEGAGLMEQTIRRGVRESTANAYLRPARGRPNLTVFTGMQAERLLLQDRRACGVRVRHHGRARDIIAAGEVILAAGAIGSPHLLLISGIGPAEQLQRHDIQVVADLPAVGDNLHDHPDVVLRHLCPEPVSLHRHTLPLGKALAGLQWFLARSGPAATNHFDVGAFIRSGAGIRHPDLQLSFLPLALAPGAVQSDQSIGKDGFQVHIDLVQPRSRGALTLRSGDPADSPHLVFNYLADAWDRERLAQGLLLAREIIAQPAMDRFRGLEVTPGPGVQSIAELERWVTDNADTAYHPVGTCRMGAAGSKASVVDPACRVIGIEALRVADASIMPSIVSGNTNAATIMIAERVSDMVLGLAPLLAAAAQPWQNPRWREVQR